MPGRGPVLGAVAVAASAAALLDLILVWGIGSRRWLPPGLAGTPGDRGPLVPVLALVAVAATLGALLAGRRWLRAVARATGSRPPRDLLRSIEPSAGAFPRGLPAAGRGVGTAVGLAIIGSLLVAAGVAVLTTAGTASAANAGSIVAVVGCAAILLAAGLVPAILRAVSRREAAAAHRRGEGPVIDPGARSPLPGVLAAAVLAGLLLVPLGTRAPVSTDCALDEPWRCEGVVVRADRLGEDPYAAVVSVAYAVHPATDVGGRPRRVLLIATGGPGFSGIEDGEWMLDWLDPRITGRFDVVTFDTRGTGRTDPRDCPRATRTYDAGPITGERARTFAGECVEEAGVDPGDMGRFATGQVVEDIEAIRSALGVERISLLGTSYGTVVGQAYGVAHPDRLEALVLDAPVDRSLPAPEQWVLAARGFQDSIDATLAACAYDVDCRDALPDAPRAYRDLLDRFARMGEIEASIVGSDGEPRTGSISAGEFDELTWSAMYGTTSRMSWLRALAAARAGDDRPLVRLRQAWDSPDGGSSFAYYATWCADASVVPEGLPDDFAAFADVATRAGLLEETALEIAHTLAPCVFWPGQPDAPDTRPAPVAVPTLILGATADPVTPIAGARSLLEQMPEARLVETVGGGHGSLGDECPNLHMADFLVDGRLPATRSTYCSGQVAGSFVPLAASPAVTADDAIEGLIWELMASPDVLSWDGTGTLRIGCGEGGSARFGATRDGWRSEVTLDGCSWAKRATFDGSGWIDLATWDAAFEVTSERGSLDLEAFGSSWRLTGRWDGATVNEDE